MTVRLTELQRRRIRGEEGASVGRLLDLVVRLDAPDPRVVRIRMRSGRRVAEVDAALVQGLGESPVLADTASLTDPRLAEDELLLDRHVLDAQIVDLAGKRVTRVGDVELRLENLAVTGVLVGPEPLLRRVGLRRLASRARAESLPWRDLHLTSRRGHMLMLDSPAAALHRAEPGALSHLVAHLPHVHAREVLAAVDPERAEAARRAPTARARRFPFRWIRRHAEP